MSGLRALDRKVLRDLWRLRGQVLAIALVVASGVALLVMALSSYRSLSETADAYYERYRFADVFATAKRVPDHFVRRLEQIPGVQSVDPRIVKMAKLDIPGVVEPVNGKLVSIPEHGEPLLNALAIRAGRSVEFGRPDEVVISEPFADAHNLSLRDRIAVVMNGVRRTLTVVGIALSPGFVYAIEPGALVPNDKRFGVMWMGKKALAAAYDLEGGFNDVSLSLLTGTDPHAVIADVDRILKRYGGTGAVARKDQISNWFLMNELDQQRTNSRILPTIFLAVAAFLTNTVMARLIATERSEIGLMKAFGYSAGEIAFHYVKMVGVMTVIGILLGWGLGAWLGYYNTSIYAGFYRFPFLHFRPGMSVFAIGAVVSLAAALGGALAAVRKAASLPPAEAMRPPAPPSFRRNALALLDARFLDQPTRIILRQIVRAPVRSLLTSAGIGLAVGVMVLALQWRDAIDELVISEFEHTQRQDVTLSLVEPKSRRSLHAARRLPGVLDAEPMRSVSARFRSGPRTHRGMVTGLPEWPRLQTAYDVKRGALTIPPGGVMLSKRLAEKLDVGPGDEVEIELLEGRHPKVMLPVGGLFENYIGMPAYIEIETLRRLLAEPGGIALVNLIVGSQAEPALYTDLKEIPDIGAVTIKRAAIDKFYETIGETIMIFIGFFSGFAFALGLGVTYNSARIGLSERGRELATLRVLGFTRGEISYILLGEIALLTLAGLVLGCLAGWGLSWVMASLFGNDLFRIPLVIVPSTYALGGVGVLFAGFISAALVRRRLDTLDLISVLKTRE